MPAIFTTLKTGTLGHIWRNTIRVYSYTVNLTDIVDELPIHNIEELI